MHNRKANEKPTGSVISDKCVYSEADGIVLSRVGDHAYVSPGLSASQLSTVFFFFLISIMIQLTIQLSAHPQTC